MKKQIVNSIIGLLILSSALAQDKAPATETKTQEKVLKEGKASPSVDDIPSKYLKALGGKEAVEKLHSQKAQASFDSGDGSQKAESIRKAPDKWLFSIFDDSGKPSFQQGSNGRQRWTRNSDGLSKEDVNESETILFRLDQAANFGSLFAKMELKRHEKPVHPKLLFSKPLAPMVLSIASHSTRIQDC